MLRFFVEKAGLEVTLSHLIMLYRPFHHRGLLILRCHSSTSLVVDYEEDEDQEWFSRFILGSDERIIPVDIMRIPEGWNYAREWSVSCFLRFCL